jgi:Methyltransferase domain
MSTSVAHRSIENAVAGYYSRAVSRHGATHCGVDWSSRRSQELRFDTLLEGIDWSTKPTLLDYGCGWGALAGHLDRLGVECRYVGYDIAQRMIDVARVTCGEWVDRRFTADPRELEPADHVVASGLFNVKLDIPRGAWSRYVYETIADLGALTRRRLAFNMLPPVSSPELQREDLHYADPDVVVRYSAAAVGGTVALREDYGLWEFTVIVSRVQA